MASDNNTLSLNESSVERTVTLIMAGTVATIAAVSIILNAFVVTMFMINRTIRSPFNLYLLNLAVCDIVIALFDMCFMSAYGFHGRWQFTSAHCTFFLYIDYVFICGTTNGVMLISLDRFSCIFFPVCYRKYHSTKVTLAVIAALWTYLHAAILPYLMIDRLAENLDTTSCFINLPFQPVYGLTVQIVAYWLPLIVIAVCYLLICIKLRSRRVHPQRTRSLANEKGTWYKEVLIKTTTVNVNHPAVLAETSAERHLFYEAVLLPRKRERRLYRVLSWLTFCVVVFWTPADVYFTLCIFKPEAESFFTYAVVICLQYCTCLVNPIVYPFSIPEIRVALRRITRSNRLL